MCPAVSLRLRCGAPRGLPVPPTSSLIGRLRGSEQLAALFGFAFLLHQTGGFFSSWLGGLCLSSTGGYAPLWCADLILTAGAALVSLRVEE